MAEIVLKGTPREVLGKQVKQLRREGLLPAVIYGNGPSQNIVLDLREASKVLAGVTSSHVISVEVKGKKVDVLVRERQRNPLTGALIHIDFQAVAANKKLRASVPVVLEGESEAVNVFGGILVHSVETVDVEALPRDLPERLTLDISALRNVGDVLYVRDIVLPGKVTLHSDPDSTVVVVTGQTTETEEAAEAEEGAAEPEVVEGRGKKEEEDF